MSESYSDGPSRVLIIGLDGASPHLVDRWRNDLPHLNQLMSRGVHGILQSVIPPRSIPAWYCFATGMNPAKLGVFGFSQRIPKTYDYTFANLTHCRAPTCWEWLNRQGYPVVVAHVPGTFPPKPVDGALISGWPAPTNRGNLVYTHPPHLSRTIDNDLSEPFQFLSALAMDLDNDQAVLADRRRILRRHGDVAIKALRETIWRLGIVVFSSIDRASHQFWRHLDPQHSAHNPNEAAVMGDALRQIYIEADRQVGRLLELTDEDDTVFIVSDHGFGPAYRTFYLNEWLLQKGYLVLKDSSSSAGVSRRTKLMGHLAQPLYKLNESSPLFRSLAAPFKRRALSNFIRDEYVSAKAGGLVRINHLAVDWDRTRAYSPDEGSLYLNIKGRDPQGSVDPGDEAQELLAEIERGLGSIHDPVNGQPIPVTVHRKESVYNGPFLDEAPELLIAMDGYATEVMAEIGSGQLFSANTSRNGTHTLDGLFIACGPDIAVGGQRDASLLDVSPTVIHILGAPIADTVDGHVLLELFAAESEPRNRPVATVPAPIRSKDEGEWLSAEELAQVEQQLKDLGYLQ